MRSKIVLSPPLLPCCAGALLLGAVRCSTAPPTGPACKAQVDLPNDDDLANWSHHASVATTGDEVLKSAMAGSALVSFVFGMEVTADLVRAHAAS